MRVARALPVQLAASRTRASTSSIGTTAAILARGSTVARSRVTNETSASISASGASSVPRGAGDGGFREQHLLRIEGRDIGGQFGDREREIAGDAHEGTHAHDLAVADAARGGNANDAAQAVELGGTAAAGRSCARLRPVADAAERAAQRDLHAFRHGGEIGLAVERRENGAAHESRAAKTGQDRAAEPLHRDAAAIDESGVFAVDRQRRLVAEIDVLGSKFDRYAPRRLP